jgi:hypothetical protein
MFSTLPEPEQIKTMANKRGTLPLYSAYRIGELTSGASGGNYLKKCLLTYHTILSHGTELCTICTNRRCTSTSPKHVVIFLTCASCCSFEIIPVEKIENICAV